MAGLWEIVSWALTIQLVLLVGSHLFRVTNFATLSLLARSLLLSLALHGVAIALAAQLAAISGSPADGTSVSPLTSFSVIMLAFAIALTSCCIEGAVWVQRVFVPLVRCVESFYYRVHVDRVALVPVAVAQAPGIDLRGKVATVSS